LVQEPFEADRVWPCVAVPEMAGRAVFEGARLTTAVVWLLVALVEP
jgi:hypothetical protein